MFTGIVERLLVSLSAHNIIECPLKRLSVHLARPWWAPRSLDEVGGGQLAQAVCELGRAVEHLDDAGEVGRVERLVAQTVARVHRLLLRVTHVTS